MGVNSAKLNLDLGSIYAPKAISEILADISQIDYVSEKSSKLNGFVRVLEDELTKIHAFKHELPLSMLILNNGLLPSPSSSLSLSTYIYIYIYICVYIVV